MWKPKTALGGRHNDRVQSSPGNLRERTHTARNKNKDPWQLLCAWDIEDEIEEIGGLSIASWTKRSAKPKSAIDTSVCTSSTWQNYLCTTGVKCSNIADVNEFVDSSLTTRLKPRAHSAPEPQSRQSPQRDIADVDADSSKSKQGNGISASTKTFDPKRTQGVKASGGAVTNTHQRPPVQQLGNVDLRRNNSVNDSKPTPKVQLSKSAINVSRLQLTLNHRHHDSLSEEEIYTVNGVTGVKTTPRRDRKHAQPHPNSASSFNTISVTDQHLLQNGNVFPEQEHLSPQKVKFSYTKSGKPGSTLTFLSDTTDSSDDRHLQPGLLDAQFYGNFGDDVEQHSRSTRLSDKKLRHMSHMFHMMESQNLSVADILNSTPRLERYISMQESEDSPPKQAASKVKQKNYGYEPDKKRFSHSENALPPVISQQNEQRPLSYSNKVQDRTRSDSSLPRVSPISKISLEPETMGNGEFSGDDGVRGIHDVYDVDEDHDVLIRDGMDIGRLTEKHRGPPGFRANTAKNPLSRARETTQKKLCTQLNARNGSAEGSIAYAPAAEESVPEDSSKHRWQSSLHYLYDMNKSHLTDDPRVQTLTESLDRGEPYQRTAGLKLSRRKKGADFNQLTIGDRTFTVAEFTASAAARAANTRKKITSTK